MDGTALLRRQSSMAARQRGPTVWGICADYYREMVLSHTLHMNNSAFIHSRRGIFLLSAVLVVGTVIAWFCLAR